MEKVNLVEPSQSMQRAGRSLIQGTWQFSFSNSWYFFEIIIRLTFQREVGNLEELLLFEGTSLSGHCIDMGWVLSRFEVLDFEIMKN